MATFKWRDRVKVHIGEMSRTAAFGVARDFNPVSALFETDAARLEELELLVVVAAPARVLVDDKPITDTTTIDFDGELVTLALPLTRESFQALPFSLSRLWAEAAVDANPWVIDDLKNAISRNMQKPSVPPSGSGPSQELTNIPNLTQMTG